MEHLTRTFDWSGIDDSRFASLLSTERRDEQRVVLVGLPDDLGVKMNNGRPGAKDGPSVFRSTLARMGARYDFMNEIDVNVPIYDAGDIVPTEGDDEAALDETHRRITEVAKSFHDEGMIVVGIGGGHDLTFPMVRGLAKSAKRKVGGINVDVHLDVRETHGSGMPFRRLIEDGHVSPRKFVEYGTGRFDNSKAHIDWILKKGATVIDRMDAMIEGSPMVEAIYPEGMSDPNWFVSIDLDSIDGVYGVSAVPAYALPPDFVHVHAIVAGRRPNVRHFDLMELSPPHDVGNKTARYAVTLFQAFISGVHERLNP